MQRSLIPLFLFLLVVFLSACQPQAPSDMLTAKLDSLENRIAANPDSVADTLEAQRERYARADEATRMRFELLRTAALFKAHRTPTDDVPMRAVVSFYERRGTARQQAWASYYLGGIYLDREDAPEAIECYYKVLSLESELYREPLLLFLTYTRLYDIYSIQYKHQNALDAARKALTYVPYVKPPYCASDVYAMIANSFRLSNMNDSAFYYYNKAWDILRDHKENSITKSTLEQYIILCLDADSLDLATRLIGHLSEFTDSQTGFENIVYGDYYLASRRPEQAEPYYHRATQAQSIRSRAYGWLGLYRCARHRGDLTAQADYAGRYIAAHDSVDENVDEQTVSQAGSQHNYTYYKERCALLTQELKGKQRYATLFWPIAAGGLVLAVATGVLAVLCVRRRRRLARAAQRLQALQEEARELADEAARARQEAQAARELADKLQEELEQFPLRKRYLQLLQNKIALIDHFKKGATGSIKISEKDWLGMLQTIDAEWDNRASKLLDYTTNLSPKEIYLCLLQYFQFSYKEMKALTGLANPSTAKKRIADKLTPKGNSLTPEQEELFQDWLLLIRKETP